LNESLNLKKETIEQIVNVFNGGKDVKILNLEPFVKAQEEMFEWLKENCLDEFLKSDLFVDLKDLVLQRKWLYDENEIENENKNKNKNENEKKQENVEEDKKKVNPLNSSDKKDFLDRKGKRATLILTNSSLDVLNDLVNYINEGDDEFSDSEPESSTPKKKRINGR